MAGQRILVVRLSALGDCVHTVPLAVALREAFPEAEIGWAVGTTGATLLRGHPSVDRFHVVPRSGVGAWLEAAREIRAVGYDVAFDVQGLAKSALLARWSGAERRIGFPPTGREGRELSWLLATARIAPAAGVDHVVDRNLALLRGVGIEPPAEGRFVMPSYDEERSEIDQALERLGIGAGDPVAALHPATTWATKEWSPSGFGAVAKGLGEGGWSVVVTWAGAREEALAAEVEALAAHGSVRVAPPTGLRALAALLGRAGLVVAPDSGPLHLGVAMGTPAVGVFGATDERRNGPYGARARVVSTEISCRPCWSKQCARRDLACLERIDPSWVVAACLDATAPAVRPIGAGALA